MAPSSDNKKGVEAAQQQQGEGVALAGGSAGSAPAAPVADASAGAAAAAPAADAGKEEAKAPAKKGKPSPPFKNPLALSEPTKEILLPFAMVFGASVLSWVAGRYRFSVLFSLIFGGGVAYAIQTLRDRVTKAAVIYADRNAQRKRVIGDEESAEWINAVLYRFWQFYEPVLVEQIRAGVEPVLKDLKVPGLTGIELQRFTLGKNPPFISSAKFLLRDNHNNQISEDRIVLNLGLGLHAPELEVVVAAKTAVASLPLCVKDVWFEGLLRIEIELVPEFPHAKTVLVTFLEKPIIDFNIVPLKSVNIMEIPGLAQLLTSLIINGVNDNLVNPEKLVIDLMPQECGKVEASKGVLLVSVADVQYKETSALEAMSLTSQEVFVEVKVGREDARTSICLAKASASEFSFNETLSLLVKGNLAAEKVTVYLKQKKLSGERLLGKAYVPVADIVNSPDGTISERLELETGNGSFNLKFAFRALANLTVDEEGDAVVAEGATESKEAAAGTDESTVTMVTPGLATTGKSGALLVILHGARDLPAADANGFSDPYVKLYYTNRKLATTPVVNKTLSPTFDFNKELTVADIDHVKLTLCVFDKDEMTVSGDDALADLDLDLHELFPTTSDKGDRDFRIEKKWFPLRKPGALDGKKETTAADLKRGSSNGKDGKGGYGHMQLTIIFRPVETPADMSSFIAQIGNPDDDLSLTPYSKGNALSKGALAVGKGLTAGVGALGTGVATGVGAVGTGLVTGVTGAAGMMGKGFNEAVNVTGKAGSGVAKHMGSFTPKMRGNFFRRRSSDGGTPPRPDA